SMGSILGTIKDVVDEYRARGDKVGVLKVRSFRPFPKEQIRKAIKDAAVVAVLDKNISIGTNEGALFTETKSCMYNARCDIPIIGYTIGHGGRDIRMETIAKIIEEAKGVATSGIKTESQFVDVREELL
ncbi:MAG: hypothetical protein PHF61_09625, partial [Bacteroidales bacterium]|nr:hypothetical protein [Bacteroidales bacterium]